VNHVGHYLLTKLLLPVLAKSGTAKEPSRVVNVSSMAHFIFSPSSGISFDDLEGKKHYDAWTRYGESKLANVIHAKELSRYCKENNMHVIAASVHPGVIMETDLKRHMKSTNPLAIFGSLIFRPRAFWLLVGTQYKTTGQGTSTPLCAALHPKIAPGGYYSDCMLEQSDVHRLADDKATAKKLWEISENLVKPFA